MLEIVINRRVVELSADFELEIEISNPLFETERIPVPFTQDFTLPATPGNLQLLGNPGRIASKASFTREYPGEIRHTAVVVASGNFNIEEFGEDGITLNFQGAIFPKNIRKYLFEQNMGSIDIGKIELQRTDRGTYYCTIPTLKQKYNLFLESQANLEVPDLVAAPLAIAKGEYILEDRLSEDHFSNQRIMRLNSYRQHEVLGEGEVGLIYADSGYYGGRSCYEGYVIRGNISKGNSSFNLTKILPAFRVGYILKQLLSGRVILNNIFDHELSKLMLLTNYSPNYSVSDDATVWDLKGDHVSVNFSNFMPEISANEFISELLKVPCATLFIQNNSYAIELNEQIMQQRATEDWSDKLFDDYTLTVEAGHIYRFEMEPTGRNETVSLERERYIVRSLQDMIDKINSLDNTVKETAESQEENTLCFEVSQTEQLFEVLPDNNLSSEQYYHWKLNLLSQSAKELPEGEQESEKETFDMMSKFQACRTTVVDFISNNTSYALFFNAEGKSRHVKTTMPEIDIDTANPRRDNKLILGIWHGMQYSFSSLYSRRFKAPLITHTNHLPSGATDGELSLLTGYLIDKYHKSFKEWVERDKKVISGRVLLSPSDLSKLDLRKKIYLKGREFFIRSMTVRMNRREILPADVELIES